MFFYQTKDRLTYQEINTKTVQLFEKFIAQKNSKTSSRKQYCLKFNIYTSTVNNAQALPHNYLGFILTFSNL
jgi:hypothetical protein